MKINIYYKIDMSECKCKCKIKNAAIKIQFALKLNYCIKNLEKFQNIGLNKLSCTLSFDEFKKIIIKKNILDITGYLCKSLESYKSGLKINPKILISVYLISNYSAEIIGPEINRHPLDNYIYNLSNNVIQQLEFKKINELWTILNNFTPVFINWSNMDKNRTIEKLVISYYHTLEHIEKIKSDNKITEIDQQNQMTIELQKQKKEIIQSIKLIDKNFDIKYLQENYVHIYNQIQNSWLQLHIIISNTMKKAYFDILSNDISNGNLLSCFTLLQDIGKRLGILCSYENQILLLEKFSEDYLTKLLVESKYSYDLIKFISFIIDLIIQIDSPINNELNIKWKLQVLELISIDFSKSFPQILILIEEKIDKKLNKLFKN